MVEILQLETWLLWFYWWQRCLQVFSFETKIKKVFILLQTKTQTFFCDFYQSFTRIQDALRGCLVIQNALVFSMFVERGQRALGDIHRSKNTSQNAKIHSSKALFLPALQFLSPGTNCAQIQEKNVLPGAAFKYIAAITSTHTRCYRKRYGQSCTRNFPLNHRHHQSLHQQFLPR